MTGMPSEQKGYDHLRANMIALGGDHIRFGISYLLKNDREVVAVTNDILWLNTTLDASSPNGQGCGLACIW